MVWKQAGGLDGEALAKAADEHFASGGSLRFRRIVPPWVVCSRLPDILFTDDRGQSLALRKLRGHRVLLNFWQSWSAPCIQELRRLQILHEKGGEGAPVIVAVNGGEKSDALSEVRRKYRLTFALARIRNGTSRGSSASSAGRPPYRWTPEGRVDGVQFGAASRIPAPNEGGGTVRNTSAGRGTKMIDWYVRAAADCRSSGGPALPLRGVQFHAASAG